MHKITNILEFSYFGFGKKFNLPLKIVNIARFIIWLSVISALNTRKPESCTKLITS
jgi:hypothetical protein